MTRKKILHNILLLTLLAAMAPMPVSYGQDDFADEELFLEGGSVDEEWKDFIEEEGSSESSEEDVFSDFEEGESEEGFGDFSEQDFDEAFDDFNGEELSFDDFEDGSLPANDVANDPFSEEFGLEPLDPEEQQVLEEPFQPSPPMEDPQMEPMEPFVETPEPPTSPEEPEMVAEPAPAPEQSAPQFSGPMYDQPDLGYEAYLYNIYLNYHKDQMPASQWQTLLQGRASETYRIQQGDTLWGISRTLFGDGNYWPKIWAVNEGITNPHLIQPGHEIRFLLGTEADAPAFTVTEASEEAEMELAQNQEQTLDDTGTGEYVDELSGIEIPPPSIVSRPVVRNLPPSLPVWQMSGQEGEYDSAGISYERRAIADLQNKFYLQGYIAESTPSGVGRVLESETGGLVATDFMYVYIEANDPSLRVGDQLSVVRDLGPLKAPNSQVIQDFLGHHIRVEGRLVITDKVESQKEKPVFRAQVKKSINPVQVGSILVRERLPQVVINKNGPQSDVTGQIIGGLLDNRRQIYGLHAVAFLNRGSQDGLSVGQALPIRANRVLRDSDSIILENSRPIGWLQVVRTSPMFSTAVVMQANEDILAGDFTGQGAYDWSERAQAQSQENLTEVFGSTAGGDDEWGADSASGEVNFEEVPESEFENWNMDDSEFE